jgi:hypothetical protein
MAAIACTVAVLLATAPSPGLYGEYTPKAIPYPGSRTNAREFVIGKLDDLTHKMVETAPPFLSHGSNINGGRTFSTDPVKKILYELEMLDQVSPGRYQITARSLVDSSLLGRYPGPRMRTGEDQHMVVDTGLNLLLVFGQFGPSGALNPPYQYGVWTVDLAKNTTKLLITIPSTPDRPCCTPAGDDEHGGFTAVLCSKTHTLYIQTCIGGYQSLETYLIAVDIINAKIKFQKPLKDVGYSLVPPLMAVDSDTSKLWAVGFVATNPPYGGPMVLLQLCTTTGDVLSNTSAMSLGADWDWDNVPSPLAVDLSARGGVVFAAAKLKPSSGDTNYSLVRLPFPTSDEAPSAVENFCYYRWNHSNATAPTSYFATCPQSWHYQSV